MSPRNPFAELVGMVLGKSDLQSILCLIIFSIVSLVLAYLTNPSENSFRTYLTEQSFRHHLTRLDENPDDEQGIHDGRSPRFSNGHGHARSPYRSDDKNAPFHFANRASISLRTPKHVFHSFAFFTIAAMVPVSKTGQSDDRDGWSISDSWYIGAFGKWWRGGVWETWYQDVIARSKDEESWSSGILSMKNLDMLPDFQGPSFIPKTFPYHVLRQSPPKLRNRDRPVQRSIPPRSASPPPLSKTASLPLHAKRFPTLPPERSCDFLSQSPCPPIPPVASELARQRTPVASARSALFEQSPLITEVLRQISASTSSVQELRTQFNEFQSSASQAHEMLQHELDSYRDRKRQEDMSRLDVKSRTKLLDDSKRTAEGFKRDAERKLKAAQSARDTALQRMDFLDKEMSSLHERLHNDEQFLSQRLSDISPLDLAISEELEAKKQEIKATEELLAAMNRRSRELEERLSLEKERLYRLKQRSELRRQEYAAGLQQVDPNSDAPFSGFDPNHISEQSLHSAAASTPSQGLGFGGLHDIHSFPEQKASQAFTVREAASPIHANGSSTTTQQISAFSVYPTGGMILADSPSQYDGRDYPSGDLDLPSTTRDGHLYSDVGLTSSDNFNGSFSSLQLENDPNFNHHWRNSPFYDTSSTDSNPTSGFLYTGTSGNSDLQLSKGQNTLYDYHHPYDGTTHVQIPSWAHQDLGDELSYLREDLKFGQASTPSKKKGLNPDAKVFNLPRKCSSPSSIGVSSSASYDALNPNGLGVTVMPSATSSSTSLLRAFAPSPAEREALQRALGGSTNNSFERLPSLSDVGSIPSSPSHIHSSPLATKLPQQSPDDTAKVFNLPSWLPVFPTRKSKFKPWDDEEPVSMSGKEIVSR